MFGLLNGLLTAVGIGLIAIALLLGVVLTRHSDNVTEKPFLCLPPYSTEYCQANQEFMYKELARRSQ